MSKFFLEIPELFSIRTYLLQLKKLYFFCRFGSRVNIETAESAAFRSTKWFEIFMHNFYWLYVWGIQKVNGGTLPYYKIKSKVCKAAHLKVFEPKKQTSGMFKELLNNLYKEVLDYDAERLGNEKMAQRLSEVLSLNTFFWYSETDGVEFMQRLEELNKLRNALSHVEKESDNEVPFTQNDIPNTQRFLEGLILAFEFLIENQAYPRVIMPIMAESDQWGRNKIYFLEETDYKTDAKGRLVLREDLASGGILQKEELSVMYQNIEYSEKGHPQFYCFDYGSKLLSPELLDVRFANANFVKPFICQTHNVKNPDWRVHCKW